VKPRLFSGQGGKVYKFFRIRRMGGGKKGLVSSGVRGKKKTRGKRRSVADMLTKLGKRHSLLGRNRRTYCKLDWKRGSACKEDATAG